MKTTKLLSILTIALLIVFASCKKEDSTKLAPTVISTYPVSNETNAILNEEVTATFSQKMDITTLSTTTFTLKQGSVLVPGTVSYTDSTAVFTPSASLIANTEYNATITTGAENTLGIALKENKEWSFTTGNKVLALDPVFLGTAANYLVLAKTAINNSPTSELHGDLGLSPAATSYITGFSLTNATGYATSDQVTGHIYAANMADPTPINLTNAVKDMITAYNDAAGRKIPDFLELGTGNIGGKTLTPGLYKWTSTVTIPTDVAISGGANDVWIFQISGDLNMSTAVNLTLIGDAKASNIFWQVAGEATFGANSHFEGIILSMTGITFLSKASFKGRALAQTAVVFDENTVILPD